VEHGWAVEMGYPALALDGDAVIAVQLLESVELPEHWDRLDAFEGPAYRRVTVDVDTDEGTMQAQVYIAAE